MIAEIRLAFPKRNALTLDLLLALERELTRAGEDPLLITGDAGAFSAGLDLAYVRTLNETGVGELLLTLDRVCQHIFEHPAPTVALVTGHAIAGGCAIVQACDLRIAHADPRTRIGMNTLQLGVCAPPGVLRMLRHRLTARDLEKVLLHARLFDPAGAMAAGLIDRVSVDAEAEARSHLAHLASIPRSAFACTKTAIRHGVMAPLSRADELRFHDAELPMWSSADTRARIEMILARRSPSPGGTTKRSVD